MYCICIIQFSEFHISCTGSNMRSVQNLEVQCRIHNSEILCAQDPTKFWNVVHDPTGFLICVHDPIEYWISVYHPSVFWIPVQDPTKFWNIVLMVQHDFEFLWRILQICLTHVKDPTGSEDPTEFWIFVQDSIEFWISVKDTTEFWIYIKDHTGLWISVQDST